MIFLVVFTLISTLVLGVMTIGAAQTGSIDALTDVFYASAAVFFLILVVDTVLRTRRHNLAQKEFSEKLEKAMRGTLKS